MARLTIVQRRQAANSLTPVSAPEPSAISTPQPPAEKFTVYTTAASFKAHAYNVLISLLAVMLMAALQSGLTYMQSLFPDLSVGASQAAAAFAAVKFLGR